MPCGMVFVIAFASGILNKKRVCVAVGDTHYPSFVKLCVDVKRFCATVAVLNCVYYSSLGTIKMRFSSYVQYIWCRVAPPCPSVVALFSSVKPTDGPLQLYAVSYKSSFLHYALPRAHGHVVRQTKKRIRSLCRRLLHP